MVKELVACLLVSAHSTLVQVLYSGYEAVGFEYLTFECIGPTVCPTLGALTPRTSCLSRAVHREPYRYSAGCTTGLGPAKYITSSA